MNLRRGCFVSCLVLTALTAWTPRSLGASLHSLRNSVYKITVVGQEPDFREPWKKNPSGTSFGTGFYIGDGRVLTNAHVVANASFISIQRDGDSKPVPAFVTFIAHDCDLALLTTKDPEYFEDTKAMVLGSLPRLRSPVSTIGFPTGGEQISVTQGVVSRVGYRRYVHHGYAMHLLVQVDSAINPGNSGGPVVQGRRVVGVAFQSFTQAENTGYIIPTPVVRRFLKDVEDGRYDGHPDDGLTVSRWTVMNPSTAEFHGLREKEGGIKISHVASWAPTHGKLKAGDIVLEVDGQKVGVDGKVDFLGERVDFRSLFDLQQIGNVVTFEVARGGRVIRIPVQVTKGEPHHITGNVYAKYPKYYIYGGLVFTTLSRSFLQSWGSKWYLRAPLLLRYLDLYDRFEPEAENQDEIIVFARRLPDRVNAYADRHLNGVVTTLDKKKVRSLTQLADLLEYGKSPFIIMEFWGSEAPLVLSRSKVMAANERILAKYGIKQDRWFYGPEVDGAMNRGEIH